MFTLVFTKKHFIFDVFRFVALVMLWAAIRAFSNLNFVIDGWEVYKIMLYDLFNFILAGRSIAGIALVGWLQVHHTLTK